MVDTRHWTPHLLCVVSCVHPAFAIERTALTERHKIIQLSVRLDVTLRYAGCGLSSGSTSSWPHQLDVVVHVPSSHWKGII